MLSFNLLLFPVFFKDLDGLERTECLDFLQDIWTCEYEVSKYLIILIYLGNHTEKEMQMLLSMLKLLIFLRKYSLWFVFLKVVMACSSQSRSLFKITPRYSYSSTTSIWRPNWISDNSEAKYGCHRAWLTTISWRHGDKMTKKGWWKGEQNTEVLFYLPFVRIFVTRAPGGRTHGEE